MEDHQIVELYLARDPAAVQATEDAYGVQLLTLARRILGSIEDGEEAVSDTYLAAWNSIPPQRPRSLYAYLAKICRNAAFCRLDWKNAQKRRAEVVALTDELSQCIPASGNRLPGETGLRDSLNSFLGTLDPDERRLFLRRYWFADTIGELSERFGLSQGAVKARLNRTRKKLKNHLEREGMIL